MPINPHYYAGTSACQGTSTPSYSTEVERGTPQEFRYIRRTQVQEDHYRYMREEAVRWERELRQQIRRDTYSALRSRPPSSFDLSFGDIVEQASSISARPLNLCVEVTSKPPSNLQLLSLKERNICQKL